MAISESPRSELVTRFLKNFYAEEYDDPTDPVGTSNARDIVPRSKIISHSLRYFGDRIDNPSRHLDVAIAQGRMYSGFMHGASPQIMDLCLGDPPKFHIMGMWGTQRMDAHAYDSWNYYFRTFLALINAAHALKDHELENALAVNLVEFQRMSGRDGGFRIPAAPTDSPGGLT